MATSTWATLGTGTFTQSGGGCQVNGSLYLGYNSGSTGTYNLSGGGTLGGIYGYCGYEYVGYLGQRHFHVTRR